MGKSTVAKLLAQRLGILYLDTGATYRALAFAARQAGLNPVTDVEQLTSLGRRLPLELQPLANGSLQVLLHGQDISDAIRTEGISEAAAQVSQHADVRKAMVALQRRLANRQGVVVEGRDTGSVVFPRALYKFFLDANPRVRAARRQQELQKRYGTGISLAEVREQLEFRDELDRTRRVGPLVKPKGAIAIDTSHRRAPQVVSLMLRHICSARRSPAHR
ncbi:MAG: (d)CMP kinase [Candidatus Omnitrophica bacterium]|nr:(d)CMP kinase [Candidatus Omnitrophota bacterium]